MKLKYRQVTINNCLSVPKMHRKIEILQNAFF